MSFNNNCDVYTIYYLGLGLYSLFLLYICFPSKIKVAHQNLRICKK